MVVSLAYVRKVVLNLRADDLPANAANLGPVDAWLITDTRLRELLGAVAADTETVDSAMTDLESEAAG